MAQAARIADSLAALPLVRREATAWQATAGAYQLSVRAAWRADSLHYRAFQNVRGALQDERLVSQNEAAKFVQERHRARRRGLLNYLLTTALCGVGYLVLHR